MGAVAESWGLPGLPERLRRAAQRGSGFPGEHPGRVDKGPGTPWAWTRPRPAGSASRRDRAHQRSASLPRSASHPLRVPESLSGQQGTGWGSPETPTPGSGVPFHFPGWSVSFPGGARGLWGCAGSCGMEWRVGTLEEGQAQRTCRQQGSLLQPSRALALGEQDPGAVPGPPWSKPGPGWCRPLAAFPDGALRGRGHGLLGHPSEAEEPELPTEAPTAVWSAVPRQPLAGAQHVGGSPRLPEAPPARPRCPAPALHPAGVCCDLEPPSAAPRAPRPRGHLASSPLRPVPRGRTLHLPVHPEDGCTAAHHSPAGATPAAPSRACPRGISGRSPATSTQTGPAAQRVLRSGLAGLRLRLCLTL